ncbi:MAG: PEP-CTERM sorting domain-containing protein [Colwellia sp.]|nr:PEP-CTERM sorting domain-containing protein [Colwellia sp.]
MKLKFLNKALTGLILSLSCLINSANAGLILSDSTDITTGGQSYSEVFDVSAFQDYINLVFTVSARGDYDGSDTAEFIEFLIDGNSYGQFHPGTAGVTSAVGPSGQTNYDIIIDFSFTISDLDWNTLFANDSQVNVEWKNGINVGPSDGFYVSYTLTGEPNPVPAPFSLAVFALALIGFSARRFKK